jgi:hypothetical protein
MNITNKLIGLKRHISVYNKPKIFGIGANKTGTTSLKIAMEDLGYVVGIQRKAENLIDDWAIRDFNSIKKYCFSAQFFQDIPFSLPYTYVAMDQAFPNSKFILTVRDSPEQWYNSITKFHAKKWGKEGRVPTKEDLQNATYIYKGSPWHTNRLIFKTPEEDPYEKQVLNEFYIQYNKGVIEYFKQRPKDLLVLNVAEKGAYKMLCEFLNIENQKENFPWENKTLEQ